MYPGFQKIIKQNTSAMRFLSRPACFLLSLCLLLSQSLPVRADEKEEALERNRALPIQSNEVPNWPTGPVVGAESAILMEADTGAILYAKNIHQKEYPASTTKILTSLIVAEESKLNEVVTFSHDAVFDTPRDSNHIAMDVGDTLTIEECLNAILIRSANECAFAVAEHVGGTREAFVERMNERAGELGCLNSNFVNPNGLHDENHYTTAYDLAMIGRAFFANEMLCNITLSPMLVLQKESGEYRDVNKMDLIPGHKYAYEYLIGCKTGYTSDSRYCLVSAAEKDGMKLICVVMRDENPYQNEDTIALFNYGFSNFEKVNVSQTETKYNIDNTGFFYTNNDIFGSSKPILSLNRSDCVIVPKTVSFSDLVSEISYNTESDAQAAVITYSYHDVFLGSAAVDLAIAAEETYVFDEPAKSGEEPAKEAKEPSFIFINVILVLLIALGCGAALFVLFLLSKFLRNYHFTPHNNRRTWRREQRRRNSRNRSTGSSVSARRQEQIRQARLRQQRRHRRDRGGRNLHF